MSKIDLTSGIGFHIEGELGKYNTLPIDALIKISQNLQNLLVTLAKANVNDSDSLDLDNFKIELSGFEKGSAIPLFIFTPRTQTTLHDISEQRNIVNVKFEELMVLADSGNYSTLADSYDTSSWRNEIVESLFSFTQSFGNSPVAICSTSQSGQQLDTYKINKLKVETKKSLIIETPNLVEEPRETYGVGRIKTTYGRKRTRTKVIESYNKANTVLSYSPDVIVHENTSYILNFPLRCSLEKEDDYYIIQAELLDLIGTGETEDEAERNFAQEFSFIYKRYNEVSDENLSDRIRGIKQILNIYVKETEN